MVGTKVPNVDCRLSSWGTWPGSHGEPDPHRHEAHTYSKSRFESFQQTRRRTLLNQHVSREMPTGSRQVIVACHSVCTPHLYSCLGSSDSEEETEGPDSDEPPGCDVQAGLRLKRCSHWTPSCTGLPSEFGPSTRSCDPYDHIDEFKTKAREHRRSATSSCWQVRRTSGNGNASVRFSLACFESWKIR